MNTQVHTTYQFDELSDEAIKESLIANEVEFNEDGSNHY